LETHTIETAVQAPVRAEQIMLLSRSRKQVYELTLDDLNTFPIWEFKLDAHGAEGQDEATVQPYTVSGPLDPTDRMFVVRTAFTLADGSRIKGYITPPVRGREGVDTMQPVAVMAKGQVRFWCGTFTPDPKRLAHSYNLLGKEAARVFPLRFESEVQLKAGPARGSIPGFLVLEDFQTRKSRTVM
jgi:hypothetical protein